MPRYSELAAQVLARADRSSAVPAPEPAARARAIDAVAAAIAARARTRTRRRWTGGVAAVAAAAAMALVALRWTHPAAPAVATQVSAAPQVVAYSVAGGPSVVVSGAQSPLAGGRPMPAGSRLVTPADGRAVLSFATGTSVVVDGGGDLTVADEGLSQILRLDAGTIDVHVAKLGPSQRFLVEANDTEVEVRGTRFRVTIAAAGACTGRTMVDVSEGVVAVRREGVETTLTAGQSWPLGCARTVDVASLPRAPAPPAAAAPASTLREQNDLYARAVAARRRGDDAGALAILDRFLAVYPRSPLLESVIVERMRVLRTAAPSQAVGAARDYLGRYPDGFARTEAEALAEGR